MNLTPGTTIAAGSTVTRQTIYDLLANATGGIVTASELDADVLTIVAQSEPPSVWPGKLWWDQTEELMKVYVDQLDGTGVSLWCSIGPDRFDIPVIADMPIPFGAAVQLSGAGHRHVTLPPAPTTLSGFANSFKYDFECWKVMGFNNTGVAASAITTESGAWMVAAVEGLVWAWYPLQRTTYGSAYFNTWSSLISCCSATTGPYGYDMVRGGVLYHPGQSPSGAVDAGLVYNFYSILSTQTNFARALFLGAVAGRHK